MSRISVVMFNYEGQIYEVTGHSFTKELTAQGDDNPVMGTVLVCPNVKMTPMDELRGQGTKRSREEDNEAQLELPEVKRRKGRLPDAFNTSDDEEEVVQSHQKRPINGWLDEGPSDPQAPVWQELWDPALAERATKAFKRMDEAKHLEDLHREYMENIEEDIDFFLQTFLEDYRQREVVLEPRHCIDSETGSNNSNG